MNHGDKLDQLTVFIKGPEDKSTLFNSPEMEYDDFNVSIEI